VKDHGCLIFESDDCHRDNLDQIEQKINHYYQSKDSRYWVSFDIDGVDAGEFQSTGTAEDQGLSLDFIQSFFSRFAGNSVGMDFTEVNFELAPSAQTRLNDECTFR